MLAAILVFEMARREGYEGHGDKSMTSHVGLPGACVSISAGEAPLRTADRLLQPGAFI